MNPFIYTEIRDVTHSKLHIVIWCDDTNKITQQLCRVFFSKSIQSQQPCEILLNIRSYPWRPRILSWQLDFKSQFFHVLAVNWCTLKVTGRLLAYIYVGSACLNILMIWLNISFKFVVLYWNFLNNRSLAMLEQRGL